jgi:hypothetical protein
MRHARIAVGLLGSAMALIAADPYVGTWKLDPAKSKYKSGGPPKEQTVVITQQGDREKIVLTGTAADGSPVSARLTVPIAGGEGTVEESERYDAVSVKRISDHARESRYSKGGKHVMTLRSTISKDGTTMTNTLKGVDRNGKPVEGTAVYDKQ